MKSNLLKSIFISLILVMGVANMSAATITSDGTARLYFDMSAVNWWVASSGNGNFAYFFNSSTNKWSAHSVNYSGNTYYVVIPSGSWTTVILTRNNTSTSPSWDNKWNQTGNITLSSTSNYISKFSENSTSATWGTAVKPASTGSLSASATSVDIGTDVTLTPSLTSNADINTLKSTSYSISPNSGASINGNTFTATKAGTYTITATITYHPNGYSSLTSTVKPTKTITVNPWTITWNPNGGSVTPTSSTYDGATAVSLPTPTRTGYNFDGWFTAASGGTQINDIGTTTKPTSNVTYYAHWTPKTYTITLDANGGASNGSATATYNNNAVTNATYPTRTYYRCNGYYTATSGGTLVLNTDGTLAKSVSGYTDANGNWIKDGTATLYAQWTYDVTEYTVTFGAGTDFTSYGSVTAYNNTTSASITSPATVHSGQSVTFTATPETGYIVEGWYTNAACTADKHHAGNTEYTTSITGTTNVYVKFVEKTWSVDFAAGIGGTVTTPSSTPQTVGQVTGISIAADPATGYTFNQWTITSGSGSFTSAATTNSNKFKPSANSTVTASFTETMSTLTTANAYDNGDPDYDAPTAIVASIGIATTATVTATAAGEGYTFEGWTLTNCTRTDNGATNATSITVRSNGDGEAATVTANYKENLSTVWTLAHSIDNFNTTSHPFTKKTGESTGEVAYYSLDLAANTNYQFKVVKNGSSWYGNNNSDEQYWIKQTVGDWTFSSDAGNCHMKSALAGTYTFKIDYSDNDPKVSVYFPEVYAIAGSFNEWSTSANPLTFDGNVGTTTVHLTASSTPYTFKVIDNGVYGGMTDTEITQTVSNQSIIVGGGDNIRLVANVYPNGDYLFSYNTSTNQLTVTYPTSYTVSYSQQPTAAADAPTTSPSVESGKYVAANTSVTFTAKDANNGYTWKGWYDNNAGTGTALSANKEYEKSITANTTIYAVYTVNTYSITYNLNGGTNPDGIATQYQVTTANITLPTNPTRTGYTFAGWYDNDELTGDAITQITKGTYGNKEFWAKWTADQYTITWDANGGSVDPASSTYTYDGDPVTMPTPTRTGYTFNGWFTAASDGTQVNNVGKDNKPTSNVTYYAQWTANTYNVTLSQTGAATQGTTSVPATYDADMPNIPELPTAANGYAFMGYWDGENGTGKLYYNAGGTSVHKWDKADNATLYAFFQKAQITEITLNKDAFDPVEAGGEEEFVLATPTISPEPEGNIVVCWRLLYNNGNEVAEYEVSNDGCEENRVKFPIAGLAAGTYQIEATLYTGTACGSGTPLDTLTKNFLIASGYTVTIKYTCDGTTIQPSTTAPGQATEETEITAPDIFGYTFNEWVAGDGVTIKSTSNDKKTITYTAYYDGYLTATYTQQTNIIYFNNTLGWENVYVYFYTGDFWNDSYGSGAVSGGSYKGYAKMEPLGDSTIWYATNTYSDISQISFTPTNQNGQQYFKSSEAIHTWSFNSKIPMYVPIKADEETKNGTKYYNKGYWMNYPNNTGYTLRIFSQIKGDGTMDLAAIPFQFSEDKKMPMTIDVELGSNQTYGYKIYRADEKWFGNNGTMTYNNSGDEEQKLWDFNTETDNCGLTTTIPGTYTFTLNYQEIDDSNSQYNYTVGVKYPGAVGDYRVLYTDTAATNWSGNTRTNNWYHPSKLIINKEEGNDTISFFVNKDKQPTLQIQQIQSISNTGAITWENVGEAKPINVDKDTTYNFIFTHTESALELVGQPEIYTGSYYVRSYALNGRWLNYKTDTDNRMTYSAFSESDANSFGDKYSHYITKWCEEGTNVKFVVANEFSPCLTDTLIKDIGDRFQNIKDDGSLNSENGKYKANVRFMWNRATNKISRAYVGSASEATRQFLVLKADREIKNETGQELSNEGDSHNNHRAVFNDTQNWIYERTIQVQPQTRVKLYACYPITQTIDTINAQYFRGAYDENKFGTDENSVQILGGQDTAWNTMRIIYDFKTNRLLAAWVPSEDITGEKSIAADVMILREHQKDATCITLTNDESKLEAVKNVYGVLRINRWILNNRGNADDLSLESCTRKEGNQTIYDENTTNTNHPVLEPGEQIPIHERGNYFISFPFDVHLSDVFGFGQYGTHWIISDYNGLRRAKRGFFYDNCVNEDCTNWDYIWEPDTFVMKANKGYLLSLDLDLMKHDNIDFWAHNVCQVELFFPSTIELKTIERTNYQMDGLSEEYLCKINHNKDGNNPEGDRRVKDSYWRCIGVPSFANYDGSLTEGENGTNIIWKTDYTWTPDESGFPFLYEWNTTDNSLTPRSTSSYKFRPTFAYLIQNGNPIYWSVVNTKPASIVAKEKQQTTRNYEWKITLKCNNKQDDQTFIRMTDHENVTTDFDFNQDLVKEFNYGRSDIYTLIGYEKAAANSLPLSELTTLIPLGLSIEYNGDYTIAMPDGTANIGVTLIDTDSNTRTNLSAGMEYTLTLKKGDYNNRFFIEISPIQQTPTDIEYVENSHDNQARKVLIDNILYIVRDGQIFDARGARLK